MTEAEWLACSDWRNMFEFISGKVSDRKLRLFAVACGRGVWPLLDGDSRRAVELAERYADGLTTLDQLRAARSVFRCTDPSRGAVIIRGVRYRRDLAGSTADDDALWAAKSAMRESADAATWDSLRGSGRDFTADEFGRRLGAEMTARRRLLHETLGPRLFRPVDVDSTWLTSAVVALAEGTYQDRAFDRLPILADALMDAGCDNEDVLNHCRSEGPHVRGCWLVDLLTGRK